ncbi:unnamed protein product [Diatraea saccharalis]|uniref:MADF domain-containing protein n=1 Tax=Diatraea saccharalis TaxID=40085 RepID=A0A9N9WDF9_9NEOP|nr:unnamed protein product [Diatraea saccharalis]
MAMWPRLGRGPATSHIIASSRSVSHRRRLRRPCFAPSNNMTKMSSRQYREKLIDEVKKYPVLYDTRHENHRDIDIRDRCWLKISEKLGANSEVLKREWKILRDSMRQALKRTKRGVTTKAGVPCKKWRFESRMAFILPYMTMRRNQRLVKDNDIDVKMDEMEETAHQSEEESEVWDQGHSGADQDSLDLFFASVCQSSKRLPKKFQNSIKRQVLDVLLRVEEEFESEQVTTKLGDQKNF